MDRRDQVLEGLAVQRAGAGGKRVHAPAVPRDAAPPTAPLGFFRRELEGGMAREARARAFSYCRLLREWDPFLQAEGAIQVEQHWWPPFHLRRRQPIHEVIAAEGLVLVLSISGVCTAYDQDASEPLCFLNVAADENVRSLFVDREASALLTVSTFGSDQLHLLKVRSTPLASIRAGRPHAWRPLFESEVLRYPGFVEFDDVSNLVITFSAESGLFKLWELRNPLAPRFQISSQEVRDVKVAAGALLLLMDPGPERANDLRLRVLDLVHGDCVQDLWLPMWLPGIPANNLLGLSGMEVVELFGLYLLTKQTGGPLFIRHILTGAVKEVPRAAFATPSAFIFLPFNNTFLTFYKRADAQLWDFEGNCLATLAGAWLPSSSAASTVYVSDGQDLLFVYCPPGSSGMPPYPAAAGVVEHAAGTAARGVEHAAGTAAGGAAHAASVAAAAVEGDEGQDEDWWWEWSDRAAQQGAPQRQEPAAYEPHGCIKVFDLLTGRQVAVVQPPRPWDGKAARRDAAAAAAARAALQQCSSLFYCEASRRIYTGTADGKVQAWGL